MFQCGTNIFCDVYKFEIGLSSVHPHLQHIELIDITYIYNFYITFPKKVP